MVKRIKLFILVSVIFLVGACFNTPVKTEDYSLYFEGATQLEVDYIDVEEKNGQLDFSWKTDTAISFYLETSHNMGAPKKLDLNEDVIVGIRKVNCEIDQSYTEMSCFDINNNIVINYTDISSLIEEIPATLFFGSSFYDEDGDRIQGSSSSFKLVLK